MRIYTVDIYLCTKFILIKKECEYSIKKGVLITFSQKDRELRVIKRTDWISGTRLILVCLKSLKKKLKFKLK